MLARRTLRVNLGHILRLQRAWRGHRGACQIREVAELAKGRVVCIQAQARMRIQRAKFRVLQSERRTRESMEQMNKLAAIVAQKQLEVHAATSLPHARSFSLLPDRTVPVCPLPSFAIST